MYVLRRLDIIELFLHTPTVCAKHTDFMCDSLCMKGALIALTSQPWCRL